jgi:hypothetical protein
LWNSSDSTVSSCVYGLSCSVSLNQEKKKCTENPDCRYCEGHSTCLIKADLGEEEDGCDDMTTMIVVVVVIVVVIVIVVLIFLFAPIRSSKPQNVSNQQTATVFSLNELQNRRNQNGAPNRGFDPEGGVAELVIDNLFSFD